MYFVSICTILGRPNILTLWAENSVGLQTQLISPSVIVDVTPPEAGELTCPLFVQVCHFRRMGVNFKEKVFYAQLPQRSVWANENGGQYYQRKLLGIY